MFSALPQQLLQSVISQQFLNPQNTPRHSNLERVDIRNSCLHAHVGVLADDAFL